jgi:hypothetical protein
MENQNMIPADECSIQYNIEVTFINSLYEAGLIEITAIEDKMFIHQDQLSDLEKYIRLHYDLDINVEGLETISNMLEKMKKMQHQIATLQNRLQLYDFEEQTI